MYLPFNGCRSGKKTKNRERECTLSGSALPREPYDLARADLKRQLIENLRFVRVIDTDLNLKQSRHHHPPLPMR